MKREEGYLPGEFSSSQKQPLPPAEGAEQLCVERNKQETCINPHEYVYRGCTDKCKYYVAAQQQPTAEGAEEIKQAICDEIQKSLNGAKLKHIFTDDEDAMPLVDWLSIGDTIAEGQEEIENLVEQIYFDMDSWPLFATLHAQKIADKMVSERLREELIKLLADEQVKFTYGVIDDDEIVDKYLKSRDSHE